MDREKDSEKVLTQRGLVGTDGGYKRTYLRKLQINAVLLQIRLHNGKESWWIRDAPASDNERGLGEPMMRNTAAAMVRK